MLPHDAIEPLRNWCFFWDWDITVDQVRNQLYNAYGGRQIGTIYTPSNDYQVILESLPECQADPSGLSKLFLKTNANVSNASPARMARASPKTMWLVGRPRRKSSSSIDGRSSWISE